MRRPLPVHVRGPRRAATVGPSGPPTLLLGCPRISPHWQMSALGALVKPQLKEAILHRGGEQAWPAGARQRAVECRNTFIERGIDRMLIPELHFPAAGEYFMIATVANDAGCQGVARALAVGVSRRLPGVWFVVGRLFVRDGQFFRRQRGRLAMRFALAPARDICLPRDLRARLRGVL